MPQPQVAAVLVNYNGREHLEYCLPSLAMTGYRPFVLIVVDNGSTDGSVAAAVRICPDARLIRNRKNLGWSAASNIGIRLALELGAKYIALVNNDIRVDPRWLDAAVAAAERAPGIGLIGYGCVEAEDQVESLAQFERERSRWVGIELSYPAYVGGMAMLVRSELFREIGMIDDGFFAYGEENDFQIRARKAGYVIAEVNLPVWHLGQGSSRKAPLRAAFWQTRHNIRLLVKHGSPLALILSALGHLRKRIVRRRLGPTASAVERRLLFSNRAVRCAVLLGAVLWNLLVLPQTLKRRWDDNRRAARTRRKRLSSSLSGVMNDENGELR